MIGSIYLFKFSFSWFIPRIKVRVIFMSQLSKGTFYLLSSSVLSYTKHLIIIHPDLFPFH